jgi:hypothetical protein
LDAGNGRKSLFKEGEVLPQRWYVDLAEFVGAVDKQGLICNLSKNGEMRIFERGC